MRINIVFAVIGVLFISCQKQADDMVDLNAERMPINLSMDVLTKATDTEFETGDKVGIYVVNAEDNYDPGTLVTSGNYYDNVCMTKSATGWSLSGYMFWKDKVTPAEFYCYYPYNETVSDVNAYPFSVASDQSSSSSYYASDFLWGKTALIGPTSSTVNVPVSHIMSRMNIEISSGGGFSSFYISDVTINSVKTSGTIDLATGEVTPVSSYGTTITPYGDDGDYRAIILPQTVSDLAVDICVNGQWYTYKGGSFTFNPGVMYNFTIKVDNPTQSLNVSINSWTSQSGNSGYAE